MERLLCTSEEPNHRATEAGANAKAGKRPTRRTPFMHLYLATNRSPVDRLTELGQCSVILSSRRKREGDWANESDYETMPGILLNCNLVLSIRWAGLHKGSHGVSP
jgi:hypothetical protein